MITIIVVCLIVLVLIAVFTFSMHGLSSGADAFTEWGKKKLKERAKKDAKAIIKLGYIVDQKWYDKTYEVLANNADDLEAKDLWEQLNKLKQTGN